MSQKLAPGKWNPLDRMIARYVSWLGGLFLLWVAFQFGQPLVAAVAEGQPISLWSALLVLVPLGLGCGALIPNFTMPVVVRIIDKFLTDTKPPQ